MTEDRKPATPGMSEVSAKFVDEAEAAGNSLCRTAISEPSDEPLVALWREARRCEQEGERYDELAGAASARGDKQAFLRFCDRRDEIQNRGFAIEKKVSEMTPETPAGWAIQATMLLSWVEAGSAADDQDLLLARRIEAHFKSLADLGGLSAEIARAERNRITALWDAYKETGAVLVARDGEQLESGTADATDAVTRATKADSAAWEALVNERCHTLGGLLVKMSAFKSAVAESDSQGPPEVLFDAIVRDLERLDGEGAATHPAAFAPAVAEESQAKSAASEGYDDVHRWLTESAGKGNEKARGALSEDFDWQNMSFVRCQDTEPVVQWPPVELTSQHGDLVYGAACVIGNHCALDLISHIKSHSKRYDGGRLLDVVREIAKRGEWDGFEVGFFSVLGNFIACGRVPISGDFDAVLAEEARS